MPSIDDRDEEGDHPVHNLSLDTNIMARVTPAEAEEESVEKPTAKPTEKDRTHAHIR